jgi:hypothetical protein
MIPPNNSYYSYSTSYPHRLSQRRPRVCDDRQGAGGDTPPSETRRRGIARSSGPRPSPSPATPELAPHLWDPLRVPATDAATPLFLPPALSLIHPALYLPASIFVLLTPARNPTSLLTAPPLPLPPADQRSVEATRDPSPEDVRPRATQSASSSSPPSRAGGGGRRTQRPVAPGIVQPLGRVPPHGHPSSSSSSSGGAPAAAVAGRGGSEGRGSGGGDNDMLLLWDVVVCFVFLGGDACGVCAETWCAS